MITRHQMPRQVAGKGKRRRPPKKLTVLKKLKRARPKAPKGY